MTRMQDGETPQGMHLWARTHAASMTDWDGVASAPGLTSRTLPLMYRSQVSHLMPNWAW